MFKRNAIVWLVLAISMTASWQAHVAAVNALDSEVIHRLRYKGDHFRDLISSHMKDYEQILIGGKGLFAVSKDVDAAEWHSYISSHNIPENYPGILALSYLPRVSAAEKEGFVAAMRLGGKAGFTIKPEGDRPEYFPAALIESAEGNMDSRLGYDPSIDPVRKAAMEHALETGKASLTASAVLRVDSGTNHGSGFRMYVPIFRNGMPTGTLQERRDALRGYIGAGFRMRDMMASLTPELDEEINFQINDGREPQERNLMYSSPATTPDGSKYSVILDIPFNGRVWTLRAVPGPGFLSVSERNQPYWVLATGFLISILLSMITWTLINTRERANALAAAMTSELRARSGQFRELALKAEESARSKSEFLAKMSLELRTPLNSVIGFAGTLLKNKAGNLIEQDLSYLGRIQENGKHLLLLIDSVLDLSKIESGRMELEWSEVDLVALVRETAAQMAGQARDRGLELNLDLPAKALPIRADAVKLKRVIISLIGNALKFTEKGKLTLRLRTEPATGAPSLLEVVDTGIGIHPDRLEKIFEGFRQSDYAISRQLGGSGLGLILSRSLLRLMGFELMADSLLGQGSTFSISFAEKPGRSLLLPPVARRASAPILSLDA